MRSRTWLDYAAALDDAFAKKEAGQLSFIRAWMDGNAPQHFRSTATCYYMFSGPDILYAHRFFPNARTYILAASSPSATCPISAARVDALVAAPRCATR